MSVNACGVGFSENWLKGRFSNDSKKLTKKQVEYLTQFGNDLKGISGVDSDIISGSLLWFGENGLIHSKLLTSNQKHAFKKALCDHLGVRGSRDLRDLSISDNSDNLLTNLNSFLEDQFRLVMDGFQPLSSNNLTQLNKYFELKKALSSNSPAYVFKCLSQKLDSSGASHAFDFNQFGAALVDFQSKLVAKNRALLNSQITEEQKRKSLVSSPKFNDLKISDQSSFNQIITEINQYLSPNDQIKQDYICDIGTRIYPSVEGKLLQAYKTKMETEINALKAQITGNEGANGDYSGQINAQSAELDIVKQERDQLQVELRKATEEHNQILAEVAKKDENFKFESSYLERQLQLSEECVVALRILRDSEITALKAQIAGNERANGDLIGQIDTQNAELEIVKQETDQLQGKLQTATEENGELTGQIDEKRKELEAVNEAQVKLQEELDKKEQEKDRLQTQLQTATEENGELTGRIDAQRKELEAVKEERDRLQVELQTATEENTRIVHELTEAKKNVFIFDQTLAQVQTLKNELKQNQGQSSDLESKYNSLSGVLDLRKNQQIELMKEIDELMNQRDALQEELKQKNDYLKTQEAALTETEETCEKLASQVEALTLELERNKNEKLSLQDQLKRLVSEKKNEQDVQLKIVAEEKPATSKRKSFHDKLLNASQVKNVVQNTFSLARRKGVGAEGSTKPNAQKTERTDNLVQHNQALSDSSEFYELSDVYNPPYGVEEVGIFIRSDEVKEGKSSIQSDVVKDDVKTQILLNAYESVVNKSEDFLGKETFDLYKEFLRKLGLESSSEPKLIFFLKKHYLDNCIIFTNQLIELDFNNFESFKNYNKFIIAFKEWCNENNFNDECISNLSESFLEDDSFTAQLFEYFETIFETIASNLYMEDGSDTDSEEGEGFSLKDPEYSGFVRLKNDENNQMVEDDENNQMVAPIHPDSVFKE